MDWGRVSAVAVVWFLGWLIPFMACALAYRHRSRLGVDEGAKWVHSPVHWILPVWLGPFVLAAVIWALRAGVPWLLEAPFVRREWVSGPDLRERHRL